MKPPMLGQAASGHESMEAERSSSEGKDGEGHVTFMIVGTPRSGTTLVQRLACELPGVQTPPETHFFGFFALDLLRRRRFPLEDRQLTEELHAFARMNKSRELNIDIPAIERALQGRCESPFEMFEAIVRHLAGDADVYGEKSPEHLLWWNALARSRPGMRFIGVVRDPRATVASHIAAFGSKTGWGTRPHIVRAERWKWDQRALHRAASALGPKHFLTLRYEDVVTNPEEAQARIARFLHVAPVKEVASATKISRIIQPHERRIKGQAVGPIRTERMDSWRREMSTRQAEQIASICRKEMIRFGYESVPARVQTGFHRMTLNPRSQWERLRFRAGRVRHVWRINHRGARV